MPASDVVTSGSIGVLLNIAKIDRAILATANNNWQKVATVIAKVSLTNRDDSTEDEYDFELIANRVEALLDEGRLIDEGDISHWRRSESDSHCNRASQYSIDLIY